MEGKPMACTTILVGKAASYDGSTMIARNDDSGSGHFTAKKFTVIHPEELPKTYLPCGDPPAGGRTAVYRYAQCRGGQGHLGSFRRQRR